MLLKIYKVFIRSKLTYGAAALASAATTNLDSLNKVQSAALRAALGARRSSPITALQVEANIPPLIIYMKEISCNYYLKARAQGISHPLFHDMLHDETAENRHWTKHFKKPLVIRARDTIRSWNIPEDLHIEVQRIPMRPPWQKKPMKIFLELKDPINKNAPIESIRVSAQTTIEERFPNHFRIFTDGSKKENSTTAAMWIPEMNYQEGWKLENGSNITIMNAKLLAIIKALEWTALNGEFLDKTEVVILSDSRSSLEALKSTKISKYSAQEEHTYRIAEILRDNGFSITLQWVPSHVGLTDNERADTAANEAHTLPTTTPCPLGTEEAKSITRKAAQTTWQLFYDSQKEERELHIATFKPEIGHWPWAYHKCRPIETAIARLRIGHIELNDFLHRKDQAPSPLCTHCNVPETIEHYLLHCRRYTRSRRKLATTLRREGVATINLQNLLGGGDYTSHQHTQITAALGIFLRESGRLYGLVHE